MSNQAKKWATSSENGIGLSIKGATETEAEASMDWNEVIAPRKGALALVSAGSSPTQRTRLSVA